MNIINLKLFAQIVPTVLSGRQLMMENVNFKIRSSEYCTDYRHKQCHSTKFLSIKFVLAVISLSFRCRITD